MKKLFATFMALVMMMSLLSVTAFAAEKTYKISVPDDDTHTYDVYQIFTGDLSEDGKVLSNVKWGKNGTGEANKAVAQAILDELKAVQNASTPEKLAVINKYWDKNSECMATIGGDNESEIDNVKAGYYLIKDTAAFTPGEEDSYSTYIVKVVNDVEIARKADEPKVEKKIVEGDNKVDVNEASIGEVVKYEITGTLPENLENYATYFYQFNDTMSKGLTYNEDLKIMIGDVNVTQYFYVSASDYSETDGTSIKATIADLLALNNIEGSPVTVNKDTKIVLTYSATLNKDAVIAGEGNPNDVTLKYYNNPNDSGKPTDEPPTPPQNPPTPEHPYGETPKDTVVTYTTKLTIQKTDENGDALTGAEFELTGDGVKYMVVSTDSFEVDENGEYWKLTDGTYTKTAPTVAKDETDNTADYDNIDTKYSKTTTTEVLGDGQTKTDVKAFVGEDGTLTFSGLGAGKYILTETTTPDGYNTIAPIKFTVSFNANDKTFSATDPIKLVTEANTLYTEIVNHSGATLPETGGIGTTIFYVVGGLLLVGAAVMLVAKKRVEGQN